MSSTLKIRKTCDIKKMAWRLKCRFANDLNVFKSVADPYVGTFTINPKTALVLGRFSQRQPQLITLSGEVRVDFVSVPKFIHKNST